VSMNPTSSSTTRQAPKKSKRRKKRRKRRAEYGDLPLCFGRHAGRPLRNVPRAYLQWASTANIPETDKWLIREFLGSRKRTPEP